MKGSETPRPFRWADIYPLAQEKLTEYERWLRKDVIPPMPPFPDSEWERHQFLVILEEQADEWIGWADNTYSECLREIGRKRTIEISSAVWTNGLQWFIEERVRDLLLLACGFDDSSKQVLESASEFPFVMEAMPRLFAASWAVDRIVVRLREKWRATLKLPTLDSSSWVENAQETPKSLETTSPIQAAPKNEPSTTDSQPVIAKPAASAESPLQANQQTYIHVGPNGTFSASVDFRSVRFEGKDLALSAAQGRMMKVLWDAWESGYPVVGKEKLLIAGVDRETSQVRDTWRDSCLWGTLIVMKRRGTYQLDLPRN